MKQSVAMGNGLANKTVRVFAAATLTLAMVPAVALCGANEAYAAGDSAVLLDESDGQEPAGPAVVEVATWAELQTAYSAATTDTVFNVTADLTQSGSLVNYNYANLTINGNGHTLTVAGQVAFNDRGTVDNRTSVLVKDLTINMTATSARVSCGTSYTDYTFSNVKFNAMVANAGQTVDISALNSTVTFDENVAFSNFSINVYASKATVIKSDANIAVRPGVAGVQFYTGDKNLIAGFVYEYTTRPVGLASITPMDADKLAAINGATASAPAELSKISNRNVTYDLVFAGTCYVVKYKDKTGAEKVAVSKTPTIVVNGVEQTLTEDITLAEPEVPAGYVSMGYAAPTTNADGNLEFALDGTPVYEFTVSGTDATITRYNGTDTELVIPSTVEKDGTTYTVTAITQDFTPNTKISSVVIPETVTSIGNYAFKSQSNLRTVTILSEDATVGNYFLRNSVGPVTVVVQNETMKARVEAATASSSFAADKLTVKIAVPVVSLATEADDLKVGDTFTVALAMDKMTAALQGELAYDSAVLELVKVEAGSGLVLPENAGGFETTDGLLSFWGNTAEGEGVVATATFKVLKPFESSEVSLGELVGSLSVDSNEVAVEADKTLPLSAGLSGTLGDVNNSGKVNIVDAQIAYDLGAGKYAADEAAMAKLLACWAEGATANMIKGFADVNVDGAVDASDALAIQYAVHHNGAFGPAVGE